MERKGKERNITKQNGFFFKVEFNTLLFQVPYFLTILYYILYVPTKLTVPFVSGTGN